MGYDLIMSEIFPFHIIQLSSSKKCTGKQDKYKFITMKEKWNQILIRPGIPVKKNNIFQYHYTHFGK